MARSSNFFTAAGPPTGLLSRDMSKLLNLSPIDTKDEIDEVSICTQTIKIVD